MYSKYEKLLKERGVRSADVSKATGIKQSTLTDWKKGRTKNLSSENIGKIAAYFNVPVDYFYTVTSDETELKILLEHQPGQEPGYYIDPEVAEIAQELHDDPDMRGLFKAARGLSKEDIVKFKEIIEGYERGK